MAVEPARVPLVTMQPRAPVVIVGRTGRRIVSFASPMLLAPMEGVTDRKFRACVLDLGAVGGACTEFLRVASAPIPERVLARELGPLRADAPVAVQIMAASLEHLAETVANAERAGASWIDLNFGCPVARVCGKGAGSAVLDDPPLLQRIVAEAVAATELPVSAKIRTGVGDTSRLGEIVDAVASGGAAMLTVHGRRRVDPYSAPADWRSIAIAVSLWRARAQGPACGNGSVDSAGDARRMMLETGCDLVMVARGALADPFVFRTFAHGTPATAAEAAAFVLRYADAVQAGSAGHARLGRLKQLVRHLRAGGVFDGREDERLRLVRASDAATFRAYFEEIVAAAATPA